MDNSNKLKSLISDLKNNINKFKDDYLQTQVLKAITEIETNFDNCRDLVNLIFYGTRNCGKTTIINALITTLTKTFEDYVKLPSCISINTYFVTIIEPSNDKNYHMIKIVENEETDLNRNGVKQITDKLNELNEESDKSFEIINESESQNS
jgi:hypothetical protein